MNRRRIWSELVRIEFGGAFLGAMVKAEVDERLLPVGIDGPVAGS
jgi:hypothetical protein